MAEKKGSSLDIVYEEVPNRPIIPVQGAFGGPSPEGFSVVAHVYAEFGTVPAREENELLAGSRVDPTKATYIRRADTTRLVEATLVFSPEAAISMGKWLASHGRAALKHRKQNQPKDESE
jgi:hypothetical protein